MSTSRKKSQPNQREHQASAGNLPARSEKMAKNRASKTEFLAGEYLVPRADASPEERNTALKPEPHPVAKPELHSVAKPELHSVAKPELHSVAKPELHSVPSSHSIFDAPNPEPRPNNRRKKTAHENAVNAGKTSEPADTAYPTYSIDPKQENSKLGSSMHLTKSSAETIPDVHSSPVIPNSLLSYSFIYFIRLLDNTKSDESTYKIGYSNDVPAYRKQLEANMPQNVKTMRVLHCKKGDADKISAELCTSIKQRELRSSWFRIKKEELDTITNTLIPKHQCEVVSESKAVIKPAKKSRKPSN